GETISAQGDSTITLTDDVQITSSKDSGLHAQNGGTINMKGGTITAFDTGAFFENSKTAENKLENIKISSGKDDAPLNVGVKATN
ncbi:hypothetical protein, partial [Bartonella phoceensis]|uniref:hypothetical protein n=2 Tax=Bartonella phoceensis TaxID=270249 RepID=UPI001ABAF1B2